jgi:hypothetical protein
MRIWLAKEDLKRTWSKIRNIIKYSLIVIWIIMWIWGIWTLVFYLWSERIKGEILESAYCIFNWCDNFNFSKVKWFPIADDIWDYSKLEILPVGESFEFVPDNHNRKFYKFTPKLFVGSLNVDLEVKIPWTIAFNYYEFESMWWLLDTKYVKNSFTVSKWFNDNSQRCYIFRWEPRYFHNNNIEEFKEWENPNNCIPIYLPKLIKENLDWLFQFYAISNNDWSYATWTIETQYRYWK